MDKTQDQEQGQEIPRSFIHIEFAAPGATLMKVENANLYPGQLILAGDYLTRLGHKYLDQLEKQQEEQQRLVKPPMGKLIIPK